MSRSQAISLLLGCPRGGTTATLRSLLVDFFDVGVNQPGMLSRDHTGRRGRRDRLAAIANRTLGEARKTPGATIVKEGTHLVTLQDMKRLWSRACRIQFFVQRTPPLQLESLIWQALDRIEVAGLGNTQIDGRSVDKRLDPRAFTVDGHRFFNNRNWDHLDRVPAGLTKWEAHIETLKETRDYRALGEGFKRFVIRHPSFEDPDLFEAACYSHLLETARRDPRRHKRTLAALQARSETQLLSRFRGIRWEEFAELPQLLIDALFRWRLGHFPALLIARDPSIFAGLHVFDFTQLQLDPSRMLESIRARLESHAVPLSTNPAKILAPCPPGTDPDTTRLDQESWHRFYWYPDFRVSMEGSGAIKPPNKFPIELHCFPAAMRLEMPTAFQCYAYLALNPNHIGEDFVWGNELERRLRTIDPVTDYAQLSRTHYSSASPGTRCASSQHAPLPPGTRFRAYYRFIDSAFHRASKSLMPL